MSPFSWIDENLPYSVLIPTFGTMLNPSFTTNSFSSPAFNPAP